MEDSERIAIAAHLHVALRRKTGRVTDTEWMASNPDYARAMVAFALAHAREKSDEDLARLALKLEAALGRRADPGAPRAAPGSAPQGDAWVPEAGDTEASPSGFSPERPDAAARPIRERALRYIGGLR